MCLWFIHFCPAELREGFSKPGHDLVWRERHFEGDTDDTRSVWDWGWLQGQRTFKGGGPGSEEKVPL